GAKSLYAFGACPTGRDERGKCTYEPNITYAADGRLRRPHRTEAPIAARTRPTAPVVDVTKYSYTVRPPLLLRSGSRLSGACGAFPWGLCAMRASKPPVGRVRDIWLVRAFAAFISARGTRAEALQRLRASTRSRFRTTITAGRDRITGASATQPEWGRESSVWTERRESGIT